MPRRAQRFVLTWLAVLAVSAFGGAPAATANELDSAKPTVLITGANRGIGLGFARFYAENGWNVIATARNPSTAAELEQLAARHANLLIEPLDVVVAESIAALRDRYRDDAIDLLINNAGVLGEPDAQQLGSYDLEQFEQVMAVNVYGPLKVIEAFVDQVARSRHKKIVTLTSPAGVISGRPPSSALLFYSTSKAAVNRAIRGLQRELGARGLIVALISPGGVQTDMLREAFGDTPPSGARTVDDSVARMAKVIDGLDAAYDGSHLDLNGAVLPW